MASFVIAGIPTEGISLSGISANLLAAQRRILDRRRARAVPLLIVWGLPPGVADSPKIQKGEQGAAGKPPGSLLSAMTPPNSNPHLAFHALPRPEAARA